MIDDEEFVALARELSGAEQQDWIGVEVLGYGVREWGREIGRPHQSVSRNLSNARRKLEIEP